MKEKKRSIGLIAMMTVSLSSAMPLSEFPSFAFFHVHTITIGGIHDDAYYVVYVYLCCCYQRNHNIMIYALFFITNYIR